MLELPIKASAVYQEFLKGNFVVQKSVGGFNRISVDQALGHVNKASKDADGIIGLTKKSTWLGVYRSKIKLIVMLRMMSILKFSKDRFSLFKV
jgi:hypothetical protein